MKSHLLISSAEGFAFQLLFRLVTMKSKTLFWSLTVCLSILSLSFSSYVLLKTNYHGNLNNLSCVSIFAATLGVFAFISSFVDEEKFFGSAVQTCSNLINLVLSSSILLITFTQYQAFEKFMIEEITKLLTVRDSSELYRLIIRFLAETVDCCKTHGLVRLFLINFSPRTETIQ
jgi:hypothetical protein